MFLVEIESHLAKNCWRVGNKFYIFIQCLWTFFSRPVQFKRASSLSRNRLAQKDDEDKEENFEQEKDQLVLTGIEEWEAVHRYDLQVTDEWEGWLAEGRGR